MAQRYDQIENTRKLLEVSVARLCREAEVSRSAYYEAKGGTFSPGLSEKLVAALDCLAEQARAQTARLDEIHDTVIQENAA